MNRNLFLFAILGALSLSSSVYAAQTPSYNFSGALEETKSVDPNGGNINTTIDPSSGALAAALNPGFLITSNSGGMKDLDMTVTANTQTGFVNAIYNDGTYAYVVMTNSDAIPPVSSVNDIKTLAPTPSLNPNAIAYLINDPPNIIGTLQTEFIPSGNYWKLHLSKNGQIATSITIPAALPYANTFSGDDEAGNYRAVVTLSFV